MFDCRCHMFALYLFLYTEYALKVPQSIRWAENTSMLGMRRYPDQLQAGFHERRRNTHK